MWKFLVATLLVSSASSGAVVQHHDIQLAAFQPDSRKPSLIPIAIIRNGKLLIPSIYKHPEDDTVLDKFNRLNYPSGAKFYLTQAGQNKGQVQVNRFEFWCDFEFVLSAKSISSTTANRKKNALAVSENIAPPHPDFQRVLSPEEQLSFIQMSQKNLAASYPAVTPGTRHQIHQLVATKASASGNQLLVGSISFTRNKTEYWLFAIYERTGQDWRTAVFNIHRIQDLEDRKDAQQEGILDQLDIDGDGVDEFFTISTYYEAASYAAYTFKNGSWLKIYDSGVHGC